jgi:hypothetical protein
MLARSIAEAHRTRTIAVHGSRRPCTPPLAPILPFTAQALIKTKRPSLSRGAVLAAWWRERVKQVSTV